MKNGRRIFSANLLCNFGSNYTPHLPVMTGAEKWRAVAQIAASLELVGRREGVGWAHRDATYQIGLLRKYQAFLILWFQLSDGTTKTFGILYLKY